LQVYGITRLAGEHAALAEAPRQALVIRTCGLYGVSGAQSKGGNFVDKRIAEARQSRRMEMGNDQTVSPTASHELSLAVLQLLDREPAPGIYHLVCEGECTWFEFTREIVATAKLECEVVPVDRGGRSGDMRRPLYSVLANTRARALGIVLPHWRDALRAYLSRRQAGLDQSRAAPSGPRGSS
jgi:dTDP-4-dehydrorhamnose reductase